MPLLDEICTLAKTKNLEELGNRLDSEKIDVDFWEGAYTPVMKLAEQGEDEAVDFLIENFYAFRNLAAFGYMLAGNETRAQLYLEKSTRDRSVSDTADCQRDSSQLVHAEPIILTDLRHQFSKQSTVLKMRIINGFEDIFISQLHPKAYFLVLNQALQEENLTLSEARDCENMLLNYYSNSCKNRIEKSLRLITLTDSQTLKTWLTQSLSYKVTQILDKKVAKLKKLIEDNRSNYYLEHRNLVLRESKMLQVLNGSNGEESKDKSGRLFSDDVRCNIYQKADSNTLFFIQLLEIFSELKQENIFLNPVYQDRIKNDLASFQNQELLELLDSLLGSECMVYFRFYNLLSLDQQKFLLEEKQFFREAIFLSYSDECLPHELAELAKKFPVTITKVRDCDCYIHNLCALLQKNSLHTQREKEIVKNIVDFSEKYPEELGLSVFFDSPKFLELRNKYNKTRELNVAGHNPLTQKNMNTQSQSTSNNTNEFTVNSSNNNSPKMAEKISKFGAIKSQSNEEKTEKPENTSGCTLS